jgi:translocation and assembly module TamB
MGWETAVLFDGSLEPESPLEIQIALRNTDLADLQELAGSNYPLTGAFTGQIRLNGTKENLSASGHMQLIGGAIYNEPYHSLSAEVRFQGQEAELQNVVFEQDGGTVTGGVAYTFDTQAFSFHLTGSRFDLAHIAKLQSKKLTIGGRTEFEAAGSGTVSQPFLNARLSIAGLTFNGESEGNLVVTAVSHGPTLHVEGHSNMQFASASLNGDVQLLDDLPAEIHLDLTKLDFDPLLRVYLAGKVTGHSSVSGKFVLRGPLLHPHQITITGDIEEFFADVQNIKLQNQGPVRFSVSNQVASIQELHLIGTDTEITGSGTIELTGARRIDLHGNGHVNLAMLQTLNSSMTSSGQLTFTMNATGKLDAPSFSGNMQIANGALAFVDLPNGLSEINGTFSFDLNRLRVQRLTAKTGGGNLTLGGYITYSNGIFFDLTATGKDIRIRYPEGVSSQATADLRLVGGVSTSVLSGDVTVTRFALTPQFDLASYVQRAKQPPSPPNPNSIIDNVRLDVHVVSTPELRVETSLARLSGDVDLRLRGTVARPAVMGRLSIAEGDITFNSTTYHLERGDVVFANPVRIEPVINVEASARVRDYDITLGFHGTPDKLNVTYRSEPPLPSADIIALLAFGRTRQESEIQAEQGSQVASSQSFAETASNAILGQALNSAVSSRVQKLFGVSRIKIDPNLGGTEDNPNARLTIEQQISKDVTVTYLTNLGQYAEEVLQVEYNINKNVSLVAVRDYTGVLAIDLRIRQRKR